MMRARGAIALRRTPHLRCAHGVADPFQLLVQELDAGQFVGPAPVVGDARGGHAPLVADVGIEVDGLVSVGQIFRLRYDGGVAREIFCEEIAVSCAPARSAGRRVHGDGGADRAGFEVGGAD